MGSQQAALEQFTHRPFSDIRVVESPVTERSIEAGHYERVAEALQAAQVVVEQRGDAATAGILAAAHQLSLACSRYRAETESYQQAYHEAVIREQELRQQLHSIIEMLSKQETAEAAQLQTALSILAASKTTPLMPGRQDMRSHRNWRQSIRGLLGRLLMAPESQIQTAEKPANTAAEAPDKALRKSIVTEETQSLDQSSPTPPSLVSATPELLEPPPNTGSTSTTPSLTAYCLGPFRVYEDEHQIEEWPGRKGKAIFKYLLLHRHRPVVKDVLMELFWPDSDPDAARNNLNVAIYGLRRVLRNGYPDFSHVLFQDDCYFLNPELQIWTDIEEFTRKVEEGRKFEQSGNLVKAAAEYQSAEALYQGELFEEDRYEDWFLLERQGLQDQYLRLLDWLSGYYYDNKGDAVCLPLCQKILRIEPYREDIHRRLMLAYCRQGHRHLALRQYYQCCEILRAELNVLPDGKTTQLYEEIRTHQCS